MKLQTLKFTFTFLFALAIVMFTSCESTDANDGQDFGITEDQTIALVESDDVSDEVDNIVDDYLSEDFSIASKNEASKNEESNKGGRPDCVTKTIVFEGDVKTVTLDFGEACILPNEHTVSGKIVMSYTFDIGAKTTTVTQSFENFSFNDIIVEGENTIIRTKENENGNPQNLKTINVKLTWPDGETSIKVGEKTREFTEGSDTKTWGDNVYSISGNWTNTFSDGTVYSSTITNSLRREMACKFLVSGTIDIVKAKRTGTIDFGDGSCDNIATFTNLDGETTEITLKRRKR